VANVFDQTAPGPKKLLINNCYILIASDGRTAALLVVSMARYDSSSRLALHPAKDPKM